MGDLPESFPISVRVMTKHAEKTRVGLWGQSAILKAVWDVTLLLPPLQLLSQFSISYILRKMYKGKREKNGFECKVKYIELYCEESGEGRGGGWKFL